MYMLFIFPVYNMNRRMLGFIFVCLLTVVEVADSGNVHRNSHSDNGMINL